MSTGKNLGDHLFQVSHFSDEEIEAQSQGSVVKEGPCGTPCISFLGLS